MAQEWKIYTKTGDKGYTALIGGDRVPKYHEKIEAYGTVDELNSFIGLIRDQDMDLRQKKVLLTVQERLFTLESLLAKGEGSPVKNLPELKKEDVELLEKEIDLMNSSLPELTAFILPGGATVVSYCHIARTVCRRAERLVIKLSENHKVDNLIIQYLNRLSDYLFVLARKLAKDLGITETIWNPNS